MRLYNTLTRSVVPFEPLAPPVVTMYVCGPTVYDVPHIGHARSAYIFDVLRRYLECRGHQVTFVRNVTDVDDKIIGRARQELGAGGAGPGAGDLKAKCQELAARYLKSYHDALDQLGVRHPDKEPKATDHVIPDPKNVEVTQKIDASMTGFISQLITKNMAYPAGGDVYFPVRKFADYGKLSNRSLDDLKTGARIEPGEHKEDPLDFALWKASKPGEPSWMSPWGPGRPGWHIECSTMSTAYLGDAFDIHGGGVDLVFPHHENEIAQAQAAGKPFAKYWVHNGLLTVNGEKMSKSLGNYITAEQVLQQYQHPDYLKIFFLKAHYRSPIDYSVARMDEAKKNWQEFLRFFQHCSQQKIEMVRGSRGTVEAGKAMTEFAAAMDDDLNTPKALAALFDLVNAGHRMLESKDPTARFAAGGAFEVLMNCGRVLGLFQQGLAEASAEEIQKVQALIVERDTARKAKDFKRADEIRDQIKKEGYLLADTAGGTLWQRAE